MATTFLDCTGQGADQARRLRRPVRFLGGEDPVAGVGRLRAARQRLRHPRDFEEGPLERVVPGPAGQFLKLHAPQLSDQLAGLA